MGRGMTLTKEMYRKMGRKTEVQTKSHHHTTVRGGRVLPYSSERMDPRSHVRFS